MKRVRFKPSLRDQQRSVARLFQFMAGAAPMDKRESAQAFADAALASVPAAAKKRAAPVQREAPVVAAIAELLAVHPRVLFAVRQNSGMASYEAKSGRYAPVFFYRILTGQPVTVTDFWGILKDGRMLAVEAKRPGWSKPSTDTEIAQANFLALVRNAGGVSLFATSAEDVAAALA